MGWMTLGSSEPPCSPGSVAASVSGPGTSGGISCPREAVGAMQEELVQSDSTSFTQSSLRCLGLGSCNVGDRVSVQLESNLGSMRVYSVCKREDLQYPYSTDEEPEVVRFLQAEGEGA